MLYLTLNCCLQQANEFYWDRLPRAAVKSPSFKTLGTQLDMAMYTHEIRSTLSRWP